MITSEYQLIFYILRSPQEGSGLGTLISNITHDISACWMWVVHQEIWFRQTFVSLEFSRNSCKTFASKDDLGQSVNNWFTGTRLPIDRQAAELSIPRGTVKPRGDWNCQTKGNWNCQTIKYWSILRWVVLSEYTKWDWKCQVSNHQTLVNIALSTTRETGSVEPEMFWYCYCQMTDLSNEGWKGKVR